MQQSQRNVLFGGLAVVVLGAAGFFLLRPGGGDVPEIGDEIKIYGRCLAGEWEGYVTHPRGERAPYDAEGCPERAVYPLFYCQTCKRRFVPNLVRLSADEPYGVPRVVVCPADGSGMVMPYYPGFIDESEIVGDLPWPKWRDE